MKNTYIITGAGKGSGRYFAKAVVTTNANVALLARTADDLSELKAELQLINPKAVISTHPVDLADPEQTKNAFETIKSIHANSIKALICFAGVWIKSKPVDEIETMDFMQGFQANFFCAVNAINQVIKICAEDLAGLNIITIGGTSGTWMNPAAGIMSVAKGAVAHYSKLLAKELLPKQVHVAHIIIDGPILNERGRVLNPDLQEDDFIRVESVAKEILHVVNQTPDCWTYEWDIRPYTRKTKIIF